MSRTNERILFSFGYSILWFSLMFQMFHVNGLYSLITFIVITLIHVGLFAKFNLIKFMQAHIVTKLETAKLMFVVDILTTVLICYCYHSMMNYYFIEIGFYRYPVGLITGGVILHLIYRQFKYTFEDIDTYSTKIVHGAVVTLETILNTKRTKEIFIDGFVYTFVKDGNRTGIFIITSRKYHEGGKNVSDLIILINSADGLLNTKWIVEEYMPNKFLFLFSDRLNEKPVNYFFKETKRKQEIRDRTIKYVPIFETKDLFYN